ncbi:hypothetical protein RDI58_019818 [Solanum bulbocastanum]|uniref:Uncharacterized protein n=1 Tax=Solanum bulbocastanum TaxID=147425 RepID=A0AAN8Y7B4_SOLBU
MGCKRACYVLEDKTCNDCWNIYLTCNQLNKFFIRTSKLGNFLFLCHVVQRPRNTIHALHLHLPLEKLPLMFHGNNRFILYPNSETDVSFQFLKDLPLRTKSIIQDDYTC